MENTAVRSSKPSRAVLVFADGPTLDLARRRWPRRFARLLQRPDFERSCSLLADVHVFSASGSNACGSPWATSHPQQGRDFGERLSNAVSKLRELGYQELAVVGRDCPGLALSDIEEAFRELGRHRLVLGPDHSGGVYLIGLRISDSEALDGIRWRRNTDFQQLKQRFQGHEVHLLKVKQDLDCLDDLRLLARSQSSLRCLALDLLQSLLAAFQAYVQRPLTVSRLAVERPIWQLPPP